MAFGKRLRLTRLRLNKRGKDKDCHKPLLNNIVSQHREAVDAGEVIFNTERTNPVRISTESGEVLRTLRNILTTTSNPRDIENAADVMTKWSRLNGVTNDKKEGSYSQDWLCDFLQLIDESVEKHFPILPEDETQTFLKSIEKLIESEVCRLTPVLKDAGLLHYLIQSYIHQLFNTLDLLLNRNLTVNVLFWLLHWVKCVFISPRSQDVSRVLDPLQLSGWFKRAEKKLLTVLKKEISGTLHNILCIEENNDNNNERSEEWFIQLHIDVTQCLHGAIKNAKAFSLTLMHEVQILCQGELHSFVQNYVQAERRHLENLQPLNTSTIYLCRIMSNCKEFRCFAVQINNLEKNKTVDDLNTICLLKKLEDHVLSFLQNMIKHKAQVNLKKYFKNGDEHIQLLMEEIQQECQSLPQIAAEEIKTIIVNLAYDNVSRVYLDCLMMSKFKKLEKRWDNVEKIVEQDIQSFHNTFTELNCNVEQNQLLKGMSEVLVFRDMATLKLTCATLFKDFPEESEHYLPRLLRWKRTLSRAQVRDVLDVARPEYPKPAHDKQVHPLMGLCCCLSG